MYKPMSHRKPPTRPTFHYDDDDSDDYDISPSSPRYPSVVLTEYNKLLNDPDVKEGREAMDKLGEILARVPKYRPTKDEIDERNTLIDEYEDTIKKHETKLNNFRNATIRYKNYNPKLQGGSRSYRNSNQRQRQRQEEEVKRISDKIKTLMESPSQYGGNNRLSRKEQSIKNIKVKIYKKLLKENGGTKEDLPKMAMKQTDRRNRNNRSNRNSTRRFRR
jgi:hypothetical protein